VLQDCPTTTTLCAAGNLNEPVCGSPTQHRPPRDAGSTKWLLLRRHFDDCSIIELGHPANRTSTRDRWNASYSDCACADPRNVAGAAKLYVSSSSCRIAPPPLRRRTNGQSRLAACC